MTGSVAMERRPAAQAMASACDTFSGETILTNGDVDMLPLRDVAHVFGPAYVGDAHPTDPLVSPALADLSGLPPLFILAGDAESLLSCAERVAANSRGAGVDTQFTVYPEKVSRCGRGGVFASSRSAHREKLRIA